MSYPRFLQRLFANAGAGPKLLGSIIPFGTTAPKSAGTASAGTLDEAARADHVHPQISEATTSVAGLMSAADKLKLNGIETGAQIKKVIKKGERKSAGDWTISGCTPGMPLLVLHCQNHDNTGQIINITRISGAIGGSENEDSFMNAVGNISTSSRNNALMYIPTDSTVVLRVGAMNSSVSWLEAYQ